MALEEFKHFFQENKKDSRVNDKGKLVPDKCDKCGSKIAVFLHGEPIYQCTNKKCKKYFGTVPCNINESYMTYEWLMKQKFPDPDSTSGTSDFDESDDNDPNDCYSESVIRTNSVYTNGGSIEKINDFPFDKVYFGSPHKIGNTLKLDGPLFITPYPGIASIFAVRPQNLQKYGVQRGQRVNRDYEEWDTSKKDSLLQQPLKELHMIIQGASDIKPSEEIISGYIYTIDVTPEIRNHIYQSQRMNKTLEFCIDKLESVSFSNIEQIYVKLYIKGGEFHQEAFDAVTGKEIPIDYAYTMDEMKERTYTDDEPDKIQSKEELEDFYAELKSKLGQGETIQEAKLPSKKRNKLPDSDFALVYTDANGKKIRKYPIHDEAHCKAAAHMFPRGVPLKYQGTVARKILRRAHKFGIDTSGWKNLNKFKDSD